MRLFNIILFIILVALLYFKQREKKSDPYLSFALPAVIDNERIKVTHRVREKGQSLRKKFNQHTAFNSTHCFLIDMSVESGKDRFFIYNMLNDSIEGSGLVTHGRGSGNNAQVSFSNSPGSNCSSIGKYKIGAPYVGKFGLAYKLYGLDETNNKAFERFVVLHAHDCVPDREVYPELICESLGCPTVSPSFLQKLSVYLKASKKPVLLYIYQ